MTDIAVFLGAVSQQASCLLLSLKDQTEMSELFSEEDMSINNCEIKHRLVMGKAFLGNE